MMKRILCAINTDSLADSVFNTAYELSQKIGAELALYSVLDDRLLLPGESGFSMNDMRAIGKKEIQQLFARLLENKGSAHVASFSEEGNPKKMIVSAAENWKADLIVMASHTRTGLSRVLMGSVAEAVLRHSQCPVLIVPAHKQQIDK